MAVSQNNGLPAQASPEAGGAGQSPLSDADFRQALQQQISDAIQPVLDEFRLQMSQGLSQPPDGEASGDRGPQASHDGHGEQASSPAQGATQNATQDGAPDQAVTQAEGHAEVPVKNVAHTAQRAPSAPLGSAPLGQALQGVEHLGAQWLQSVVVSGLGALLAEPAHAAVQQRAEQVLHSLLQKLFDAAPSGMSNRAMQQKTERTLQLILRDALEAVFAEPVRASLQQGGQQAIEQSLHGDVGAVLRKIQETLQIMLAALVGVLRRHQQTILRLLLAFALLALQSSLMQSDQTK